MIESREDQFLWVEKYRPTKIDDCILPESLKETFKKYVEQGQLPNFLFSGSAGVGKTTVAKALCNEIGADWIMINGSDEGRMIETLRVKIKNFASTVSLTDAKKVVIIDEADYMNPDSVQPALRSLIEEFSANCRFIFTCNFKHKILEPVRSRCSNIDFKVEGKDKQYIAAQFYKRVTQILKAEGVEFDQKVVAELVTKYIPDWRRVLNELQRYSVSGKIDTGIFVNLSQESYKDLITFMKERNFTEVRKWIAKNSDADAASLFKELYDNAYDIIEPSTIPNLILILAEYQYKAAFVNNHELNIMAAMTEVMIQCKFK